MCVVMDLLYLSLWLYGDLCLEVAGKWSWCMLNRWWWGLTVNIAISLIFLECDSQMVPMCDSNEKVPHLLHVAVSL